MIHPSRRHWLDPRTTIVARFSRLQTLMRPFMKLSPQHSVLGTRYSVLLSSVTLALVVGCGGGSPKDSVGPSGSGALAVNVAGLPGSTAAHVTVTGPTGGPRQ